jgi:hypothetical protein
MEILLSKLVVAIALSNKIVLGTTKVLVLSNETLTAEVLRKEA